MSWLRAIRTRLLREVNASTFLKHSQVWDGLEQTSFESFSLFLVLCRQSCLFVFLNSPQLHCSSFVIGLCMYRIHFPPRSGSTESTTKGLKREKRTEKVESRAPIFEYPTSQPGEIMEPYLLRETLASRKNLVDMPCVLSGMRNWNNKTPTKNKRSYVTHNQTLLVFFELGELEESFVVFYLGLERRCDSPLSLPVHRALCRRATLAASGNVCFLNRDNSVCGKLATVPPPLLKHKR